MGLKEKLQNLIKKEKEKSPLRPEIQRSAPDQTVQIQENKQSPQDLIRINREKASKIALEIDILRSKLPKLMSYAPVERIRKADADFEEIEATLKGAIVATAELGNADEIAVSALHELGSLLRDPGRETEAAEILANLKTALREDWFNSGAESAQRLRRSLSLILIQENMAILDQQIASMKEWAGKDASQLNSLMSTGENDTARNAEILRLSNHIKKLKLGITGKETLKTELSTIKDALTYTLLYATQPSFGLVQKEGEAAEVQQTEELRIVAAEKHHITEKLIRDKVNVDLLGEKMAASGIAIPDLAELKELVAEFADPEEMLLNPENIQIDKSAEAKEHDDTGPLMA